MFILDITPIYKLNYNKTSMEVPYFPNPFKNKISISYFIHFYVQIKVLFSWALSIHVVLKSEQWEEITIFNRCLFRKFLIWLYVEGL